SPRPRRRRAQTSQVQTWRLTFDHPPSRPHCAVRAVGGSLPLVAAARQKVHPRDEFSPIPAKFAVFGGLTEGTARVRGGLSQAPSNRCEVPMARCETCGNDYDKGFQVSMNGNIHTFDSFECAIHALAPKCENCGIRIMGHGLEKEGTFFCCEHCAERV